MTPRKGPASVPRWTEGQLEAARKRALATFVEERGREGTRAYAEAFNCAEPIVRRLFELSDDLLKFDGEILRQGSELLAAARYLAGPPVSADDLETLVGTRLGGRASDLEAAEQAAAVLRSAWDPIRFPWLTDRRRPTRHQKWTAIRWTAGIWAVERVRTFRRAEASRRQEQKVIDCLLSAGLERGPRLRRIDSLDALSRGTFTQETILAARPSPSGCAGRCGRGGGCKKVRSPTPSCLPCAVRREAR